MKSATPTSNIHDVAGTPTPVAQGQTREISPLLRDNFSGPLNHNDQDVERATSRRERLWRRHVDPDSSARKTAHRLSRNPLR